MFKSLKVGWAANEIGERIERVTGYVVDILIYYRLDIKTHDTIFIFSQIYSHFTHRDYGPYLEKNGQAFIDKMDERLKFDYFPFFYNFFLVNLLYCLVLYTGVFQAENFLLNLIDM